jgi:hypothetical protein
MLFSGNERVYDPQNAPMMRQRWQSILPCHRSILRVIDPLIAREKYICLLGELSPINMTRQRGVSGLLCIARGPFLAAAAMVMEVVLGRWLLVAWCLHQDKPHSRNSRNLPSQDIFCLKYLGWSKFYLQCPVTLNRICSIL